MTLKGTDLRFKVALTSAQADQIPVSEHFFIAWSEKRCHLVLCDAQHAPFARISLPHQDFLTWTRQLAERAEHMVKNPPKGDEPEGGGTA